MAAISNSNLSSKAIQFFDYNIQDSYKKVEKIAFRSLFNVDAKSLDLKKNVVYKVSDIKSEFKNKINQLNSDNQPHMADDYLSKIYLLINQFPAYHERYENEKFKINYNSEFELFVDRVINSIRTTLIVDLETDQYYISFTNFNTKEHEFNTIDEKDSINKFLNFTYESRISN